MCGQPVVDPVIDFLFGYQYLLQRPCFFANCVALVGKQRIQWACSRAAGCSAQLLLMSGVGGWPMVNPQVGGLRECALAPRCFRFQHAEEQVLSWQTESDPVRTCYLKTWKIIVDHVTDIIHGQTTDNLETAAAMSFFVSQRPNARISI